MTTLILRGSCHFLFILLLIALLSFSALSMIAMLCRQLRFYQVPLTIGKDHEKETHTDIESSPSTSPSTIINDLEYLPTQVDEHIREFFYNSRNALCRDLTEHNHASQNPLRVRYNLSCQDLFDHNEAGTGNLLFFLYNVRHAVHLIGDVELEIKCSDAVETKRNLILPWTMGSWKASPASNLTRETPCQPAWTLDNTILDDLRYELRRMAIALVGIPSDEHPARLFVKDPAREDTLQVPLPSSPLLQNVQLDEVAIHFRCGDILEAGPHPNYGYVKWHSLAALIPETTVSIGIVTQPFQGGQIRRQEGNNQDRCAILVGALQSFLRERFPQAAIEVRNAPDETITLAYARFILARQAIAAGTSTFVTMPFRAAFGDAYEFDREEMIDSHQIFDLWQDENGKEQILGLFTSNDPS